jgi:hypothetical protein
LQQLPTPWNGDEEADEGGVIEFGGLDDSPADDFPTGAAAEADFDRPSLRISPDTAEETLGEAADGRGEDFDESDPAREVDRIEAMLAGVEGESPPSGPARPELELVFDDPDELLAEPFEEEEVVSDRLPPGERPAMADFSQTGLPESSAAEADAAETSAAEGDVPETSVAETDVAVAWAPPPGAADGTAVDEKTGVAEEAAVAEGTNEDDEEAGELAAPSARPAGASRRPAYSRLFAKLRYG